MQNATGGTVTTFTSQIDGSQKTFLQTNITPEAQYRAIQTTNTLRSETPTATFIYSMGLGSGVSSTTQAFLAQLANDPSYPTYISGQTAGQFFYIPSCPSTLHERAAAGLPDHRSKNSVAAHAVSVALSSNGCLNIFCGGIYGIGP